MRLLVVVLLRLHQTQAAWLSVAADAAVAAII
jgi:hypothetical protein